MEAKKVKKPLFLETCNELSAPQEEDNIILANPNNMLTHRILSPRTYLLPEYDALSTRNRSDGRTSLTATNAVKPSISLRKINEKKLLQNRRVFRWKQDVNLNKLESDHVQNHSNINFNKLNEIKSQKEGRHKAKDAFLEECISHITTKHDVAPEVY